MKVVLVTFEDNTKMIGFDFGEKEYLSQIYRIVSSYSDERNNHWLQKSDIKELKGLCECE